MNIEPQAEILKIGDKKYRVMRLDEKTYKKQTSEKLSKQMLSYSMGGWKNMEDVPVCAVDVEEREKERQQLIQKEQEIIKQYTKEKKIERQEQERFTHFVGIPLNTPLLVQQINMIQEELQVDFIDPRKAHLTLCVLRLHDDQIKEKVVKVMKQLEKKIKQIVEKHDNFTKLHLKSMGYFGKNPKQARVLFIDLEENKGLQLLKDIVDLVIKVFIDKELINPDELSHIKYNKSSKIFEVEKMHITLRKSVGSETFDVSDVLEKYENFEIKNFKYDQIDVSQMNKVQQNGYYEPLTTYKLIQ